MPGNSAICRMATGHLEAPDFGPGAEPSGPRNELVPLKRASAPVGQHRVSFLEKQTSRETTLDADSIRLSRDSARCTNDGAGNLRGPESGGW